MTQWQPIETAPTEKVWEKIVVSNWYESEIDGEMYMRWAQVASADLVRPGATRYIEWAADTQGMSGISGGCVSLALHPPTHWMPLPPPPVTTNQGE